MINNYDRKTDNLPFANWLRSAPKPVKKVPEVKQPTVKRENTPERHYREFVEKVRVGYKKGKLDGEIAPVDLKGTLHHFKDEWDFKVGDLYNKDHKVTFMCYLDNMSSTINGLLGHKYGTPLNFNLRGRRFNNDRTTITVTTMHQSKFGE